MAVSDWKLFNIPMPRRPLGIAGYDVLDTQGLRVGHVSGWVSSPDGTTVLIKVSVPLTGGQPDYLLPLGAIDRINDPERMIRLRLLTCETVVETCLRMADLLPEPDDLEDLIHHFPNPRPVVLERMTQPHHIPPPKERTRLKIRSEQGDGHRNKHPYLSIPSLKPRPQWKTLAQIIFPEWRSLFDLLGGAST